MCARGREFGWRKYASLKDAFWAQVRFSDDNECWIIGPGGNRYGQLAYDGKVYRTHRLAYELFVGPIPGGMHVCHTCDHPACCNPDHLFLGTHADNMADMVAKGRHSWARKVSALTAEDIRWVREQYARGAPGLDLAETLGVCPGFVYSLLSGKSWRRA